ncbi:hypothetical protein Micbo1qcDRAFT_205021 [Microdochium bolleyi]|uniref:Uncharacterized protein n=1 Tax=Microdochium bolleyi TaxID=196109 RepID=A0A136J1B8_9PEZI|nr:hypothetical protein Micbo1qcDRAFT_205021 [Microdochium bolleyi]
MLIVNAQDISRQSPYSKLHTMATHLPTATMPMFELFSTQGTDQFLPVQDNTEVAQALEIARESPEGAKDAVISNILESALHALWAKVVAQPDSYVMTRDEFAVFNYFQHRFEGNKLAIAARRRYWDNTACS